MEPTRGPTGRPPGAPIDKTSPVPLYFQIAENLRSAIETGTLSPGQRLENEIQLSERLSVSRPTVRQAIQRLALEGLVVRQRGVGTVVAKRRIQRPLALSSLYEDLRTAGREPATIVLAARSVGASAEVATALGVAPGQEVINVERLRNADGAPLAVMRNFMPADLLKDGDVVATLTHSGLYETLRERGVRFHSADEIIGARKATSAEARLLAVPRGTTVLTMTRIAVDPTGRVIDYGLHAYLAERHSFRVTLGPIPQL
jgi:GntR family transcriptional regulator